MVFHNNAIIKLCIIMLFFIFVMSSAYAEEDIKRKSSIGAGFGIPYGVLGVNLELYTSQNIAITAGVGSTIIAGPGYVAGARYYPGSGEENSRFRITAIYGTNTIVEKGGSIFGSEYESYSGLSFGIGWLWGSGWEMDIFLVVSPSVSDIEDDLKKEGYETAQQGSGIPFKFSFGYRG